MKKFKTLPEIPKCNTETQSEQRLLENGADRLACCRGVLNPQFAKSKTKNYLRNAIKQSMIKRGTPIP